MKYLTSSRFLVFGLPVFNNNIPLISITYTKLKITTNIPSCPQKVALSVINSVYIRIQRILKSIKNTEVYNFTPVYVYFLARISDNEQH